MIRLALCLAILALPAQATDVATLGETWAVNLRDDGPTSKFTVGITIIERDEALSESAPKPPSEAEEAAERPHEENALEPVDGSDEVQSSP